MSAHKPAARHSAFYWNTGEPSIFRDLQVSANQRRASTKKVERQRAGGHDPATIHGLSRKADLVLGQRRKYSPTVEGREAGQRAGDKRRRASKADI